MFSHTVDVFFLLFKKKKTFCKIEMCLTPLGISHADRSDQVFYWLWCTNDQRLLGSQGPWASDSRLSPTGVQQAVGQPWLGSQLLLKLPLVPFCWFLWVSPPATHPPTPPNPGAQAQDLGNRHKWSSSCKPDRQSPDGCPGPPPYWKYLTLATHQSRGGQTSWKGPENKYFRHVAHSVSVTTLQLCCYWIKAAPGNTDMNGCDPVPVKLPELTNLNFI